MVMTPIRGAISTDAGYTAPYSDAIAGANQLHGDVKALWDAAPQTPATTTGTGDVMVSTFVPVPPAYVDGMAAWLVPPGNNTTQPTWDWGPGAKTIKNRKGAALAAGALSSTGRYLVTYHAGSGCLRLVGPDEIELTALTPATPKNHLTGFIVGNNSGDTVNDLDIAAGVCRDAADTVNMTGSALIKRFDAAWAAGTNQGGVMMSANLAGTVTVTTNTNLAGTGTAFLTDFAVGDFITTAGGQCRRIATITNDTTATVESAWSSGETGVTYKRGGKARNSVLRVFALYKDSDGSVDYGSSARDVPPDLPSGYSKYRRTYYLLTDSSAGNLQAQQNGDFFTLKSKVADYSATINASATTTVTSKAPPNVIARHEWLASVTTEAVLGNTLAVRVRETSVTSGQGRTIFSFLVFGFTNHEAAVTARAAGGLSAPEVPVVLNASAQFIVESTKTGFGGGSIEIVATGNLLGWIDRRGRD